MKRIKKDAWRNIVEPWSFARRMLSVKRRDELDKQMERSEKLLDLTEENIMAMFQQSATNLNTYLEEAVKEVLESLRLPQSHLKTNIEFEIGCKGILSWRRYTSSPSAL